VLAIQIAVAVLVSTYAFKQAADLWKEERGRKELAGGIFGIAVFAVFLLLISLLPTSAAGGRIQPVQTGVFLCFAALSLVCTPFIRLFKENHLEENMMAMLAILSFLAFLMSFFLVVNIDP
jgi:drug/metabolite transporter superfamily protein YnfA